MTDNHEVFEIHYQDSDNENRNWIKLYPKYGLIDENNLKKPPPNNNIT